MKLLGLYIERRDRVARAFEDGLRVGSHLTADHVAYALGDQPAPRARPIDEPNVIGFPVGRRRGVADGWQVTR